MNKKKARIISGFLLICLLIFTYLHAESNKEVLSFPSTKKISEILDTSKKDTQLEGNFSNSTIFLYVSESNSFILLFDEYNQCHAIKLNDVYTNIGRIKNGGNEYIIYNREGQKHSLKITRYDNKITLDSYNEEYSKNINVTFEKVDNFYLCNKNIEDFYGYQFVFESNEYFSIPSREKNTMYNLKDIDHLGL